MLPKRSTTLDQNSGSESTYSQLFVGVFMALRHLLEDQNSPMYFQTSKKRLKPMYTPPHTLCLVKRAIWYLNHEIYQKELRNFEKRLQH